MLKAAAARALLALSFTIIQSPSAIAAPMHPIERQLRDQFPSVTLESVATVDAASEIVGGRSVTGVRSTGSGSLRVFYPTSYGEAFVAESGGQRVVLRAVGAHFASASASGGKVFYAGAHDSVDVIEVPKGGRSEELLLLHNARAPRVFEYEIVEMQGVGDVTIRDGAIHFAAEHVAPPVSGGFSSIQPTLQIDRPWIVDANGKRSETAGSWTIVEREGGTRTIRLTVDSKRLTYPLVVDPSFSATGSMPSARHIHGAVLLPNGKVLAVGGHDGVSSLNTAALYDPATGVWSSTTNLSAERNSTTTTLLTNGKVLVAGGFDDNAGDLNTADLYDIASETFTASTGTMNASREAATATLLQSGKVLIAGGSANGPYLNTAELYDPFADTFTPTGNMTVARAYATATLLPSGKLLITGGYTGSYLNSAETFDPSTGTFTATTAMSTVRGDASATLLPNGKVLVAGGNSNTAPLTTADLFDPATGHFAATGTMAAAREGAATALLPSGKVLLAGGYNSGILGTADLYDPVAGTFTAVSGTMTVARSAATATLLPSGKVLIAGGQGLGSVTLSSSELYDPPAGSFAAAGGSMTTARRRATTTLLPNGTVLITGGASSGSGVSSAEIYDPVTSLFTATSGNMAVGRVQATATLLPSGRVLVAGGGSNTADIYQPSSGVFGPTGNMTTSRLYSTAALLPNGTVLIAGGQSASILNTAELYDPGTGKFSATLGNMGSPRDFASSVLLPNGKVLIAGGFSTSGATNTADLYDPATSTFAPTGNMIAGRYDATTTLLPNGKVLIAGGTTAAPTNTAELFDPIAGTFAATGNMTIARSAPMAVLLSSGKVLIAGGTGSGVTNTADLYDPSTGTFTAAANMLSVRSVASSMLLPNGKVLIAGGYNGTFELGSAEVYDPGLGFADVRRPVVSTPPPLLCQAANLSLSGSLFTGDSEGSGGLDGSSASNAPLLRLRRIDNDQTSFVLYKSFSASSIFSTSLSGLASGHYRVAIVSNAIPSVEQFVEIATTPALATYSSTTSIPLNGSTTITPTSLPSGYSGALYAMAAFDPGGTFTGSFFVNGATGGIMVTNAGPIGTYSITVFVTNDCAVPTTMFTLNVLGPPANIVSTGGTPQVTAVNTAFAAQLQALVTDAAGHPLSNVGVTFSAPPTGASATMSSGGFVQTNASGIASVTATANGTLGTYNVSAIVGALNTSFSLTNQAGIPSNVVATATTTTSVVVSWTATAGVTYEVQRQGASGSSIIGTSTSGTYTDSTVAGGISYIYSVRAFSPNITAFSARDLATTIIFTDPTLTPLSTKVKAAHISELRTAVNAVQTLAHQTLATFTDPTLTVNTSQIRLIHRTELRSALDAARSSLSLPAVTYTAGSSLVLAADINDLRGGVQ